MRYKVGDQVVFIENHTLNNKIATIIQVHQSHYSIDADKGEHFWYDTEIDHDATAELCTKPLLLPDQQIFVLETSTRRYIRAYNELLSDATSKGITIKILSQVAVDNTIITTIEQSQNYYSKLKEPYEQS